MEHGYDANGNRTLYRDALGNTTTWAYDALDRMTGVTYPDATTRQTAYDAAGNPTSILDPRGITVSQVFDAEGRLTGRTVTAPQGMSLEGPTTESYDYDALDRLVQATSGAITTTREYDSLSRLLSETTGGRTVTYTRNDAGSATEIGYPSGLTLPRSFDALDRPTAINTAAGYSYRGADLVAGKTLGNGLTGTMAYDGARRLTTTTVTAPGGARVFAEALGWSPRSLKTASSRGDLNGRGLALSYDPAGRLIEAVRSGDPVALAAAAKSSPSLEADLKRFLFQYDAAENLLQRTEVEANVPTLTSLPLDSSGRNRPGAVGGVPLAWDAAGNLTGRGDLTLHYDYRNRLTQVTDSGGQEVARYAYDAFNRRVERTVDGVTYETAWSGWQPLEDYSGGQLAERRLYGVGLDEIVQVEADRTGDGSLETTYVPLYDETGNLALVTDAAGKPIERYSYSPYGERRIYADLTPPEVEQVRTVGPELWLEISEEVSADALTQALAAGQLTLTDTTTSQAVEITAAQPVNEGRQAGRRLVLTPATAPAADTALELRLEPEALVDAFLNQPNQGFVLAFSWPAQDAVLHDTAAPELAEIRVQEGQLKVQLTQEADLTTATPAIQLDGAPLTWTLAANRYTLEATETLTAGSHQLTLATTLTDLAGTALATPYDHTFTYDPATPDLLLHQAPDPRETSASTVGNTFAFQGHRTDSETGLLYLRNRYYDPEMGRFLTTDPMGHVDGPSMYTAFKNSPVNYGDPLGLESEPKVLRVEKVERFDPSKYKPIPNITFDPRADCPAEWRTRIREAGFDVWLRVQVCLDPDLFERVKLRMENLVISCFSFESQGEDCGWAGYPLAPEKIGFTAAGVVGELQCGGPRKTLLHEVLHNVGKKHDVVTLRDKAGNVITTQGGEPILIRILEEYDCYEPTDLTEFGLRELGEARREREKAALSAGGSDVDTTPDSASPR